MLERFRVGRVGRVCTERRSLRFEAAPTSDGFVHLVDLAVASSHPSPASSRHPSPARAFRIVSPCAVRSLQPAQLVHLPLSPLSPLSQWHVSCSMPSMRLPCAFHAPSLRSQETARNHGVLMPKSVEVFVVLSTC